MARTEVTSNKWPSGGERWTGVKSHTHAYGLQRGQARRHGINPETWSQEPERESIPSFKRITSAMQPGQKGKNYSFDYSNMQPRGGRRGR
jgi:hypothetical protein